MDKTAIMDAVLGGLLGAAAGDAMGAATEARSYAQIVEYFGGPVREFKPTPLDTFGAGNRPGEVTDDFSLAYFLTKEIIKERDVTKKAVREGLLTWASHDRYFNRFAGPTTRKAILSFQGKEVEKESLHLLPRQATNGAAMKISPIGLLYRGNVPKAIEKAALVTMVTHDNHLAISGACAVAGAVAEASKEKTDMMKILRAGLDGAMQGEKIGRSQGRIAAGPSVYERMKLAFAIGLGQGTMEQKREEMEALIGNGLHVSEAVPCAFGLFAAAKGEPVTTIELAVNIGYDTDTIATIAGAIAGAYQGVSAMPKEYLQIVEEANSFHLEELACQIVSWNEHYGRMEKVK